MGHYDSCRDAEETLHTKKCGEKLRARIAEFSDGELGVIYEQLRQVYLSRKELGDFDRIASRIKMLEEVQQKLRIC